MSLLTRLLRPGLSAVVASLLLAAFSVRPAFAANYDYTDNWYVPAESGWGVNFTQTDNFIFATFFIYDADKKPTWYTAHLTWDGNSPVRRSSLADDMERNFAAPWIPGELTQALAGTASFTPSTTNNYEGTLTYTVTGAAKVTKAVQRLTLTSILLAADYVGGQAGSYSACAMASSNRLYQDFFNLQVTQAGTSVNMAFSFRDGALTCTLAGTLVLHGSLQSIDNATYQCSDGLNDPRLRVQPQGDPVGHRGAVHRARRRRRLSRRCEVFRHPELTPRQGSAGLTTSLPATSSRPGGEGVSRL